MIAILLLLFYLAVFMIGYSFYMARSPEVETISLPKDMQVKRNVSLLSYLKPALKVFAPIFDRIEKINIFQAYNKRLLMAGSPMRVAELAIIKGLCIFLALAIGVVFKMEPVILMVIAMVGFFLPDLWVNRIIKARHRAISRDLPVVIDLLKLCVGAGMDFMLAIQRVIKDFRPSPLMEELKLVYQEAQMGKPRREALKNMSSRINLPEISSFVRTLVQAGKMGSPIGEALRIQSEDIRSIRFQRGEEAALKAPIKLLFPLVACILPVVLIIVGGPILLTFIRGNALKF
ncbi:MAG: type II secretion system F family protein [Candidatus Gygaella obscura]|nr:type II secretion system F family protein [Candidatus Gygaella obscura]